MNALNAPLRDNRRWVRVLSAVTRVVVGVYSVAILAFVWLTKDLTMGSFTDNPVFAGYSTAVVIYVLGRFVIALFYRPWPDQGYRPTVSIIVPAFNEEDCIAKTLEACFAVDYPRDKLEIIVVNDGSTDDTWLRICDVKGRHTELYAIDLGANYGKRGAMAEGLRRCSGEIAFFVDSDSYLDRDAVKAIVAPFADPEVGGVVGHADVENAMENWLTKMQQVRYYSAFRVIKATESVLGGTVICASGCCAAYRRSVVMEDLEAWEFQTFLGRPATFGDDRALTNRILRSHKVVYQETARATTMVPETMRVFLRQQLRWKKSWLRESIEVCRYFWRKHLLAAILTYASIAFPFFAPFVVLHAVLGHLVGGSGDGLWFYLIGTYAMALLYSLYYAFKRHAGLWYHGMTFVLVYMTTLVFQTYWGILTMRDNRWGTRNSTVRQARIDPDGLRLLPPFSVAPRREDTPEVPPGPAEWSPPARTAELARA